MRGQKCDERAAFVPLLPQLHRPCNRSRYTMCTSSNGAPRVRAAISNGMNRITALEKIVMPADTDYVRTVDSYANTRTGSSAVY